MAKSSLDPIVSTHSGIYVVRDDLYPGGTKARFFPLLFQHHHEIVYATPAQGGAQTAMAHVASQLGKRCTLFVAKRAQPHDRTLEARRMGARVFQVPCGYMTVLRARARRYAADTGSYLVPFGADLPEAIAIIAGAARALVRIQPDEVWCAAGSGVLARGLAVAFPDARRHVVQVGRDLKPGDVAGAEIHRYPRSFDQHARSKPPFPSDPHYDAKAWEICVQKRGGGTVLFWNVTGPAQP